MFVPNPSSYPSPSAMELGQKIVTVIQEFQQRRTGVTTADIRAALRIAAVSTGADASRRVAVRLTILLVLAGVLVAVFSQAGGGGGRPSATTMPIVFALVVLGLIALLLVRRR